MIIVKYSTSTLHHYLCQFHDHLFHSPIPRPVPLTITSTCTTHHYLHLYHSPLPPPVSLTITSTCTTHHYLHLHHSPLPIPVLLTITSTCTTHHYLHLYHSPLPPPVLLTITSTCSTHHYLHLYHSLLPPPVPLTITSTCTTHHYLHLYHSPLPPPVPLTITSTCTTHHYLHLYHSPSPPPILVPQHYLWYDSPSPLQQHTITTTITSPPIPGVGLSQDRLVGRPPYLYFFLYLFFLCILFVTGQTNQVSLSTAFAAVNSTAKVESSPVANSLPLISFYSFILFTLALESTCTVLDSIIGGDAEALPT